MPTGAAADLSTLFGLTLAFKGPHSVFLPLAYEPVLVAYGRLEPPLLVAAVGVLGTLVAEWVNYRCFRAVVRCRWAAGACRSAAAERLLRWFGKRPFATITACALLPLPFGLIRIVALVAGYPLGRHLAATALGRFPRYWLYAAAGPLLAVPSGWILGVAGLATAVPLIAAWVSPSGSGRAGLRST